MGRRGWRIRPWQIIVFGGSMLMLCGLAYRALIESKKWDPGKVEQVLAIAIPPFAVGLVLANFHIVPGLWNGGAMIIVWGLVLAVLF